jgi:hypothetical protein
MIGNPSAAASIASKISLDPRAAKRILSEYRANIVRIAGEY